MNTIINNILSGNDDAQLSFQYMDIPMLVDPFLAREVSMDALGENPNNLPEDKLTRSIELAVAQRWLWRNESILRIKFIGIWPDGVKKRVQEVALEWTRYANLTFDFNDGPDADAHIRIAYKQGFWSYIGLYSKKILPDQPTMDLGGLSLGMTNDLFEGLVLHEFGHAIGCIHEHQSPVSGIQWNKPLVYAYFSKWHSWDKKMVDNNIFGVYSKSEIFNTEEFDPDSIMVYAIPKELTLDGYEVERTTSLSIRDKLFIAKVYPGKS